MVRHHIQSHYLFTKDWYCNRDIIQLIVMHVQHVPFIPTCRNTTCARTVPQPTLAGQDLISALSSAHARVQLPAASPCSILQLTPDAAVSTTVLVR